MQLFVVSLGVPLALLLIGESVTGQDRPYPPTNVYDSQHRYNSHQYIDPNAKQGEYSCRNGSTAQHSLLLDQVLGMWYAVEIVQHREDTKMPRGTIVVDTCPVVHLSIHDPKRDMISLIWTEAAGTIQYTFHVVDMERPGFWLSTGAQNGTMLDMPYKQFAGTVEVAKAVGTHIVLTFCTPGTELYSVVMSRQSSLPYAELRGINKMLETRGLISYSIKEACRGSASSLAASALILVSLLLVFR